MMLGIILLLLVIAAMAGFYRLLTGPTGADRVIALDLLFAIAVIFCFCAALASGSHAFLDVAIGLVLVGFVSAIAWAQLIDRQQGREESDNDQ